MKDKGRKDKVYNAMASMMTGKARPVAPKVIAKGPIKKSGRGR